MCGDFLMNLSICHMCDDSNARKGADLHCNVFLVASVRLGQEELHCNVLVEGVMIPWFGKEESCFVMNVLVATVMIPRLGKQESCIVMYWLRKCDDPKLGKENDRLLESWTG